MGCWQIGEHDALWRRGSSSTTFFIRLLTKKYIKIMKEITRVSFTLQILP